MSCLRSIQIILKKTPGSPTWIVEVLVSVFTVYLNYRVMEQKLSKPRHICYFFLVTFLLLCFSGKLHGQGKINISGGFGFPELMYGGVKYQFNQTQLGITIGTLPIFTYLIWSATGDFYYHFGGSSKLSNIRPWYGKIGFSYLKDEDQHYRDRYVYSNIRLGRDFNFSARAGIDIFAGFSFQLYHDRLTKVEYYSPYLYSEDYMPISLGICFFYKI